MYRRQSNTGIFLVILMEVAAHDFFTFLMNDGLSQKHPIGLTFHVTEAFLGLSAVFV